MDSKKNESRQEKGTFSKYVGKRTTDTEIDVSLINSCTARTFISDKFLFYFSK